MMISINLRPGKKRKPSGAGWQITARLEEFAARVKDPLLAGVVASWILVAGGLAYTWGSTARQMSKATEQLEQTATEAQRFETLMQQKRKAERIRDSLQTQISVIRGVDRGRYVWPHVLDEVAKTMPAYTWLTDVSVVGAAAAAEGDSGAALKFQVNGRTVDYQAFTQFLRQLEASPGSRTCRRSGPRPWSRTSARSPRSRSRRSSPRPTRPTSAPSPSRSR